VTHMESEPVGDGPQGDMSGGRAIVQTMVDGFETAYAIEAKADEDGKKNYESVNEDHDDLPRA